MAATKAQATASRQPPTVIWMVTSAPSSSPGRNSRNPAKLATVRPAAKATIEQMIRDRLVIGQLRASGQRASPREHGAGPGCAQPPEHSSAGVLVGRKPLDWKNK